MEQTDLHAALQSVTWEDFLSLEEREDSLGGFVY